MNLCLRQNQTIDLSETTDKQLRLLGSVLLSNKLDQEPSQEHSTVQLLTGNGFLFADHDTTIQTGLGVVSVKAGSAVLILQRYLKRFS